MTLEDLEALLENIDFMTIIYGLFEFEESGTLTISGWSKNLRTNLGYDTSGPSQGLKIRRGACSTVVGIFCPHG